jgi:hypothetical protein
MGPSHSFNNAVIGSYFDQIAEVVEADVDDAHENNGVKGSHDGLLVLGPI